MVYLYAEARPERGEVKKARRKLTLTDDLNGSDICTEIERDRDRDRDREMEKRDSDRDRDRKMEKRD